MADSKLFPPLKPLHGEGALNAGKLARFEKLSTEELLTSLALGHPNCLKTRPDGTMLDGHHRIHVLRQREVPVDTLPRDIIVKEPS